MIDKALKFLTDEMNNYLDLQNGSSLTDQMIILTNVANDAGGWAIPAQKMGVSLINIEEEKVFKDQQTQFRNAAGEFEQYNPEIKLNLYMLVCANFVSENGDDKYEQGLKQLSRIVSCFQGKNVFTPDNSPTMDPSLQKLIVELYSYSFEQQYNFWTILGAKYLPSVLYKVRLLAFQEKRLLNQNQPISSISLQANNL
jgi:Pvc16 N-terminal domain